MPLAQLLVSTGILDTPPSSSASLLRVIFYNFALALRLDHIDGDDARAAFSALIDYFEAVKKAGKILSVDELYGVITEILEVMGGTFSFKRDDPIVSHVGCVAVTYQPSHRFEHWLDVPEARRPNHTIADAINLANTFQKGKKLIAGATIGFGTSPLWLTPRVGRVHDAITRANELVRTGSLPELLVSDLASELRRLLGLQLRRSPEQAVALTTKDKIGEIVSKAEMQKTAMTAVSDSSKPEGVYAPTQFDARSYPRFRHWPDAPPQPHEDMGRTWALERVDKMISDGFL